MLRTGWNIFKTAFKDFFEDKAMRLAAAIAFYAIFSLGPVLVIVLAIAGFIWGERAARGELQEQISTAVGPAAAQQIQQVLAATQQSRGGWIATTVSLILLLIGATGVFTALRDALNTVWEVQLKRGNFIKGFLRDRLLAISVVLGIAFVLLASLIAGTVITFLPTIGPSAHVIEFIASWVIISMLFAAIFKWLPEVRISWRVVILGGLVTGFLFSIGKYGLSWYLGRSSVASVYGAAGSLVAVLMWIYYSSIIFLFGAEFTQSHARLTGASIKPSARAEPVTQEMRSQQGLGPAKGAGRRQEQQRPADRQVEDDSWRTRREVPAPAQRHIGRRDDG